MSSGTLSNDERRQNERKIWRSGLVVSVFIHILIFAFWRVPSPVLSPFAAAGPRAGDSRAAAGGGMEAVQIAPQVPRIIVPPQMPLPTLVDVEPVEFTDEVAVDFSAAMGDRPGDDQGPGIEDGDGRGDGGTAAEGLFRVIPPSPRGMIMPPTNRDLRGKQVQVWVFVTETGRVVADSTRLRPPTSDRDYNRRLIQEASQWVFEPARKGGVPVAAWFPYTISM